MEEAKINIEEKEEKKKKGNKKDGLVIKDLENTESIILEESEKIDVGEKDKEEEAEMAGKEEKKSEYEVLRPFFYKERHEVGAELELTEKEAEELIEGGFIKEV